MKRALTQKACRTVIPVFLEMLSELKQSAFKALASLGKTHCVCGVLENLMGLQKGFIER